MSRLVAEMESEGLVQRRSSSDDRRVVTVTATANGKRILHAGRRRRVVMLTERLSGLEPAEVALLDRAADLTSALLNTRRRRQGDRSSPR